jgi:hypothetical protein
METTSGSFALKGLTANKDATIVDLLRKAGLIIIGKSNLSVCLRPQRGQYQRCTDLVRNGPIPLELELQAVGLLWAAR